MPVGKFFSEDYEGLCDDIQELFTSFMVFAITSVR